MTCMRLERTLLPIACMIPLLPLAFAGCRDQANPSTASLRPSDSKHGFIAFIGAGPNDPLWPVLQASASRQMPPADIAPSVRFLVPANDSPKAQADLLRSVIEPDLRGVCIHINELPAVAPVLQQINTRGLPIVSMVEPVPPEIRAAHVGVDESAVGRELARCTLEELGTEGGTIMVLHAGHDHPFYGVRYMAFQDEMKFGRSVEVLGEYDCKADPYLARKIIRERSARYPRLSAWVSIVDWPRRGGQAVDDLLPPQTRYITVGGLPGHWPLLREGRSCIIAADYGLIGGQALDACLSAIRDPTQNRRLIGVPLVRLTPVTVDDYEKRWTEWLATPATQPNGG